MKDPEKYINNQLGDDGNVSGTCFSPELPKKIPRSKEIQIWVITHKAKGDPLAIHPQLSEEAEEESVRAS